MKRRDWIRLYRRMIDSPEVLELDDAEFRLLVSLWCLADDDERPGSVPYSVRGLQRRCLPHHSEEAVAAMVEHLIALDLLRPAPDGKGYIVPRWEQHQYIYPSWTPEAQRQRREQRSAPRSTGDQALASDDQAVIKRSSSDDQRKNKNKNKKENKNQKEREILLAPGAGAPAQEGSPLGGDAGAPTRGRDELFEELVEACWGRPYQDVPLTKNERGRLNDAVKQLRDVGATPEEVRLRAENYRRWFPGAALTPQALTKYWAQCAQPPPRASPLVGSNGRRSSLEIALETLARIQEQEHDAR